LKKNADILILSLILLLAFASLYLYRSFDDNRLTSWRWVFEGVNVGRAYAALVAGLGASYLISRVYLPGPWALFVLSYALSAAFWQEPEVIVDASRYFTQAKHLEVYGIGYFIRQWGGDIGAWTDLPLVPFIYGLIFKFIGEARIYVQLFNSAMFSLTVVLVSLLGRDLWGDRVGRSAGLLMLGMPYLFTQAPLMLVDVPSMFFLTLSVFTFNRAVARGGALPIALASIALVCAVFAKYSLWLMLSVLVVLLLVRLREAPGKVLRRGFLVFLISGAVSGAFILYKYDMFSEQMRLLLSYQRPGLARWTESYASTFLFQIHPFITAAALYSAYAAIRKRDLKYAIAAWLFILMFVMEIKRIRYVLPMFPMLALMAAYGMGEIKKEGVRRFVLSSVAVTSLLLAVFVYLPFLGSISLVNLRQAGIYLDSLDTDRVRVLTLPQGSAVNPAVTVPLLDLFTGKEILYAQEGYPPVEGFEESPLRFTWQYKNPAYYKTPGRAPVVAVITGKTDEPLPARLEEEVRGYTETRLFDASEKIFRFQTFVRLYQRAP
jgi:4-amino-4-deoxy-L-arabinose transferase-like glycosyltransferase